MDLSILIPTRNESSLIRDTLYRLSDALGPDICANTEVLIADDGTDDLPMVVDCTKGELPFFQIIVQRNSPPVGKGAALARCFQQASGAIVGFLDADLSTPPSYILQALPPLKNNSIDVVIGSRRAEGAQTVRRPSLLKEVLGSILSRFCCALLFSKGQRYQDTQCGFKFYRAEVAKSLYRNLIIVDGMADIEVLLRANRQNLRVLEIPVVWTDLRESKRPLVRTLLPDMKAVALLFLRYRLFTRPGL